jgi:N-acetylglucosamine-6-phosphate deacetylase
MVGAILDARPFTSIIVDGVHCDFAAVRIAKQVLQEKLFLITDAVTESRTGRYQFRFKEDRYVDVDDTLSGSSLNMWKAVQNTVREVGVPLEEALRMASVYPAAAIGQAGQIGKLAPGYPAQWILFNDQLELLQLHGF